MSDIESIDPSAVGIGDRIELVIVHPNTGDKRDPVAKYGGETVFVRFPDREDEHVRHGDTVSARVSDINCGNFQAAAIEHNGEEITR